MRAQKPRAHALPLLIQEASQFHEQIYVQFHVQFHVLIYSLAWPPGPAIRGLSGMPGRGRPGPDAPARPAIPLAAVTRLQARLATPCSPNRFQPLADPSEEPADVEDAGSGAPRPRASSAPPTPNQIELGTPFQSPCPSPTQAQEQLTRQVDALLTQSPVYVQDMPAGPEPPTSRRAVTFDLGSGPGSGPPDRGHQSSPDPTSRPTAGPITATDTQPLREAIQSMIDKMNILLEDIQALNPDETDTLSLFLSNCVWTFTGCLDL